ncbi:MAG: acyl-CoA thioesterase II [Chitinophagales bacterium]|nr:acyl-CoA thioesterase II [Chitinophagales bacterium]
MQSSSPNPPKTQLEDLIKVLQPDVIDAHTYKGYNLDIGSPNVYGGQVLGQAVSAAHHLFGDGKVLHSLHSYFLHPGNNDLPIDYQVQVIKQGRSFNTCRVIATQEQREIFILFASFHKEEAGIEHYAVMPNVARPESLTSFSDLFAEFAANFNIEPRGIFSPNGPFVFHPVEVYDPFRPKIRPALNHTWFKTNGALPDDPLLHQAALVYASDFNLLITALFPHGLSFFTTPMQIASLDHAMWIHRPARADEWLLYSVESSNANHGRAFCTGKIFSQDGTLIASTAQEGLIRKL